MTTSAATGTKTILLVDDEDYLNVFLEKLLICEGYNVIIASNGKQALDVYKATPSIDLILMDITMPIMNGIEAYRLLTLYDPDVSILLMSAYSQESLKGLDNLNFIRKPISPSELFNSIKLILVDRLRSLTRHRRPA